GQVSMLRPVISADHTPEATPDTALLHDDPQPKPAQTPHQSQVALVVFDLVGGLDGMLRVAPVRAVAVLQHALHVTGCWARGVEHWDGAQRHDQVPASGTGVK
ncbi:hypothetical protein Vretimale_12672, partial [Volvox reticuliferus]